MNLNGLLAFCVVGVALNGFGMYLSDTTTFVHPSAIGFVCGVSAMCISELIQEIVDKRVN